MNKLTKFERSVLNMLVNALNRARESLSRINSDMIFPDTLHAEERIVVILELIGTLTNDVTSILKKDPSLTKVGCAAQYRERWPGDA